MDTIHKFKHLTCTQILLKIFEGLNMSDQAGMMQPGFPYEDVSDCTENTTGGQPLCNLAVAFGTGKSKRLFCGKHGITR